MENPSDDEVIAELDATAPEDAHPLSGASSNTNPSLDFGAIVTALSRLSTAARDLLTNTRAHELPDIQNLEAFLKLALV